MSVDGRLRQYELLADRLRAQDTFAAQFVSLYFVLQVALLWAFTQKYNLSLGDLPQRLCSLLGLSTTLWAFVMISIFFCRVHLTASALAEMERENPEVLVDLYSRRLNSPMTKVLYVLAPFTTALVLLIFMMAWATAASSL